MTYTARDMQAGDAPQRLADRYVLEEEIATGGMATVWKASDEVLARPVAVKVLHHDLAEDPTFLERFRQEAVSAARLTHPRIVNVYDTGTEGDTAFIVMELFEGRNLAELLKDGPLDPGRAAAIIGAVLEGLAHAHEQGIVHRDVKPQNIMVADDGRVKVADFGIAKAAEPSAKDLTTTGKVLGTARYLSPEQVEGRPADQRSDVYSAGLVLYEAMTGRPPFEGPNDVSTAMMRLHEDPMPPRAVRAGIPRALETITLRALSRRAEDRYPTAEEMRLDLSRSGGEDTTQLAPVAVARAPGGNGDARPRRGSTFRSWMLVPLGALALAGVAIGAGLLMGWLELGGPLGVRPATETEGEGAARRLDVQTAGDFDPLGDDGENASEVPNVLDGNPSTVWTTEGYFSEDLGGSKPGVGVYLDLGASARVSGLVVQSPVPGWRFQVKGAGAPDALADARPRRSTGGAETFTAKQGRTTIALAPFRARFVLLWITKLAPDEGRFRAIVGDLSVLGA